MNKELKKFIKPILCSLAFLFVILVSGPSPSFGGTADPKMGDPYPHTALTREAEMSKILSVFEDRIGSQKLIEKAKDRLFTFSDAKTRLMFDLADRIAREGNTAGGDVAFLLITALIILS